jgi:predicted TIM-barrel fold metal-dependent hydrolase
VSLTTSFGGKYPDHHDYRELFATAEVLNLALFVHPSWHPPSPYGMEQWGLERSVGKGSDLCLAAARLIYSGMLSTYPSVRVVFAHLGGFLSMAVQRLFGGAPGWLGTPDVDYRALLAQVWVDTAPGIWQTSCEIKFAASKLGIDRILFGSDYPLSAEPVGILRQAVQQIHGLNWPQEEKLRIFSANARNAFDLQLATPELDGMV